LIFKGFMMNLHASRVCSTALGPAFLPPGCYRWGRISLSLYIMCPLFPEETP
jgi:hypothetical protein